MLTLKELAQQLGLSPQAVSAALAGKSGTSKVSAKTVERVQALALKLGYRTNYSARSMRSKYLKQVGLLLPKYEMNSGSPIPFSVSLLTLFGMNEAVVSRDWKLQLLQDDEDPTQTQKLPRYLREQSVDAVIVDGTGTERDGIIESDLTRFSIPFIFLNSKKKNNCVIVDDIYGATLLTQHLVDYGHKKIWFIGSGTPHYSEKDRYEGYSHVMQKNNLTPMIHNLSIFLPDVKEFQKRLKLYQEKIKFFIETTLKPEQPTALFCRDDMLALLVSNALQSSGYRIPQDISLVGYNDLPYVAFHTPALTTARINYDQMGTESGNAILNLVESPDKKIPPIKITPELLVRESTRDIR